MTTPQPPSSTSSPRTPRRRLAIPVTAAVCSALTLTAAGAVIGSSSAQAQVAPRAAAPSVAHPGLDRLLSVGTPNGRAIVELGAVPTASDTAALTALGLHVQPMTALPMAIVTGPVAAMTAAVTSGLARDVYPDEKLQYLDTESSDASSTSPAAAAALRADGLTGKGVTVAIVDSGCNATHPDLVKRVQYNVKLISGEYANGDPHLYFEVPVNQGQGTNTDIGGGHGTHVAGIVAADSSSVTDGSRLGVAPGADLACFAIGEGLFTTAVVTAFDYMIDDKMNKSDSMGIDVVNNSWGNSYRQLDPSEPMGIASKTLADTGVTVVFAAGNSGSNDVPMSLNPFSQFPWVISVAAGTITRQRADFSSNGLVYDNSQPSAIGADGHTVFTGDRIGEVHPDVMSPGYMINSSCDPLGTVVMCDDPTDPNGQSRISGTSMASPNIAGCAAVLLQANPALTFTEVREALQATATPDTRFTDYKAAQGSGTTPFWETGYGFVNLDQAVALVRRTDWRAALAAASAKADQRVLDADGAEVVRSDFFSETPPPATAGGVDSQSYTVPVQPGVGRLHLSLAFPSAGTVGVSGFSYTATVTAPDGTLLGTSTTDPNAGSGTALLDVDLAGKGLGAGDYTVAYTGDYAASDPDTLDSDSVLGRAVTLQVAQLRGDTAVTPSTSPAPTATVTTTASTTATATTTTTATTTATATTTTTTTTTVTPTVTARATTTATTTVTPTRTTTTTATATPTVTTTATVTASPSAAQQTGAAPAAAAGPTATVSLARSRISLLRPQAWQVRGKESTRLRFIVRAAKQPVSSGTVSIFRNGKRVKTLDLARTHGRGGYHYYRVPRRLALGAYTFSMSYTTDQPSMRTSATSRKVVVTVVRSRPRR